MGYYYYYYHWYKCDGSEATVKEEYYVSIDTVERTEEGYQIIFDGITTKSFDEISDSNILQSFDKVIPQIFKLKVRKEFIPHNFEIGHETRLFGKWFLLKTTDSTSEIPATISIENSEFPESVSTFIYSLELLNIYSAQSKNLSRFFSPSHFGYGNTNAIRKHLTEIDPKSWDLIHKLNVYNVGQGSLSAVTDQGNMPLFYFDLGGAWWIFPESYPRTLRLCFCITKTVIISHWDLDHVETARRLFHSNPGILNDITWIAPKQFLSPVYARMAARMCTSGRLILWSGNFVSEISFWAGKLLKCEGPAKNHNGIALLVQSPKNSIKNVLHPGDAAYTHFPGISKLDLDGLVATHHGANFPVGNAPVPSTIKGKIAYSHGNRYGHPTPESKRAHQIAGWTIEKETPIGHISFASFSSPTNVPCGGLYCDLSIDQSF